MMFSVFHYIKKGIVVIAYLMLVTACNNSPQPPQDKGIPPPLQSLKEITGTIVNYAANRNGDIDKLILNTGTDIMTIHFPPHTARQLMNAAANNTKVHVWLDNNKKPPPKHDDDIHKQNRYELISLHAEVKDATINVHDVPPPKPAPGNEVLITGKIIQWQKNDDGQEGNFILSRKLIALSPHERESLLLLLKNAHSITVKGYERNITDGFVNISGLILVKPYAITIDSVNYIVP